MTIHSASIVRDAMRNGGRSEGLTFATIYAYRSIDSDKPAYALFVDADHDDIDVSPYVKSYTCLMANGILTIEGQKFINGELV